MISEFRNKIVANATGDSDTLFLSERPNGNDWTIFLKSESWGDTDVQVSDDGSSWGDLEEQVSGVAATVNRTKNSSFSCPGGIYIRLNVNSIDDPIELVAK